MRSPDSSQLSKEDFGFKEEKIDARQEMAGFNFDSIGTYLILRGAIDQYGDKSPYCMEVDEEADTVTISKKTRSGEPGDRLFFCDNANWLEDFFQKTKEAKEQKMLKDTPEKGVWH